MSATMTTPLKRHEDFWFSDGSVVVVIESTGFRVHQSLLGKHSDVFHDLFTVPQPTSDLEQVDGCPVVQLTDALADFTDTLKAIYEPFFFDNLPNNADLATRMSFIAGILRISTKYNIKVLRNKCIDILRETFPTTLAGCDALLSSDYKYVTAEIVRAIPLARETNVPEILPWAFYISTHLPIDKLLSDPVLPWSDKALTLAGKERLWEIQKTRTHKFLFDFAISPHCQTGCRSILPAMMTWREVELLRVSPNPLERYEKWSSLKLCSKCVDYAESQHNSARQAAWKTLPNMFGLGTWEDIRTEQNR